MRLAVLGAALAVLTLAALALHPPGAYVLGPVPKAAFVALLALAAAVWALAVREVLRRRLTRRALAAALALALALRLVLLPVTPFLSSDVFRYVWDGRVQAAGIDPYRYIPADPALAPLRDAAIFPNINRATTARTIYPPAAQAVFAAAAVIAPGVAGMKAVMLGFEALAVACLLALGAGQRVLVYAWNPLPLWAFAGNGHVDALAIGLSCAALLLAAARRPALAGAVFGAAVLTKFLPLALAPALWRPPAWRMPAAALAAIAALYALHAGVGWHVLGFLPGYGAEEGLTDGRGFWLLAGLDRLVPVPVAAYLAVAALGCGALAWRVLRHPRAIGEDAALLAAAATVAASPHYPWYFAWLSAFAALHPAPWLLWLCASPVLLYLNPFGDQFFWPSLVYLPALALAVFYRPREAGSLA